MGDFNVNISMTSAEASKFEELCCLFDLIFLIKKKTCKINNLNH